VPCRRNKGVAGTVEITLEHSAFSDISPVPNTGARMHPVFEAFFAQTADGGGAPATGGIAQIALFGGMIAIFYFVIWRPQSRERKKLQEYVTALKKGDEVTTQGGIVGTIVVVEDRTVTLDVGSGTKMRVLKSYVAGPFKPVEPQPKAEARK
jgi:preprotein translocase subunit YajC